MGETVRAPVALRAMPSVIPLARWSCCARPPSAIRHPDELPADGREWLSATAPGTVAAALDAAGQWDFGAPRDLDAEDWWFRTTFAAPEGGEDRSCRLCLDGLATLAEVWLNGELVLTTDNMFRAYAIDAASHLRQQNELVLGFRSLAENVKRKRPRPRWKTALVNHQQLRWQRTCLLGRIPGWSPAAPIIGPWAGVRLDLQPFTFSELRINSRVENGQGVVTLQTCLQSVAPVSDVVLQVGDGSTEVGVRQSGAGVELRAALRIADPPLWWPHTHGAQPLAECTLRLRVGGETFDVPCGALGFRSLTMSPDDGAIRVNDVPIYCRGACWSLSDLMNPGAAEESIARDLRLARAAGLNMLRASGTALYQSDFFYQQCDELGILVWQDFPFANMDYPVEDADFAANIDAEARYQLARLTPHPCLAVLCGNSEVEQQAAMRGVPRDCWRNRWFSERLPALCSEYNPGGAYVPSTPSGGALPFHVREGVAHYYGVGAYLRSPGEVRTADVKFAAECLAFANIPGAAALAAMMSGAVPAVHHPRWKQRTPRDSGAGWDFDDVRDHYLQHLFAVDPRKLRSFDPARYLQLSRVASGEMMAQVFAEWRSGHTNNRGALVWFLKDLWPAAGWGVIDSLGIPKAAYYYLRRSWRTQQITLTDEGLDGLHLHVINETAEPLDGTVELLLLKEGHIVTARAAVACRVPPRGLETFSSDVLLDGFYDVTYAYRFGPPAHDAVVATLLDKRQRVLSEAFHFVQRREPQPLASVRLDVNAVTVGANCLDVTLCCDHLLQGVALEANGYLPDDNYFHLPPSRTKIVRFSAVRAETPRFRATLEALNLRNPVEIRCSEPCG